MAIKKVYLDMDGVLTDFEGKYRELFDTDPALVRQNKARCKNWEHFVKEESFKKLNWFPGGQKLLMYLKNKHVEVEILSSSGGQRFHNEVKEQKEYWLHKHNIHYKANIVSGRRHKKEYAAPNHILIDDTEDNIHQFKEAGGLGIYHTDIDKTLQALDALLVKHI